MVCYLYHYNKYLIPLSSLHSSSPFMLTNCGEKHSLCKHFYMSSVLNNLQAWCPRIFSFFVLIVGSCFLIVSVLLKRFLFLAYFIHLIISIRQDTHISFISCLFVYDEIIPDSMPYRTLRISSLLFLFKRHFHIS